MKHFLSFCLLLLSIALPPHIHCQETDYGQLLEKLSKRKYSVLVPLRTQEKSYGDISVTLQGEELVDIDGRFFVNRLPFNERSKVALKGEISESGRLTISTLELFGVEVRFDSSTLSVSVSIPLERMSLQELSYNNVWEQVGELAQSDSSGYSFYSNFRYGQSYTESPGSEIASIVRESGSIESALSISGWVFETGGDYRSGLSSSNERHWRKRDTRLSRDIHSSKSRLMLGDLVYPVTGFQGFNPMAGISLSTNKYLNPYRLSQPTGHQSFQLEYASTVEVLVNNRLVRRLFLQRGNYRIQDLPGVVGINDVVVRVIAPNGEVTELDYSFVFNHQLLPQGDHDFSYSLGVFRRPYGVAERYSDDPVFSGFHKYGFYSGLTAGINMQLTRAQQLFGAQGQLTSKLGSLSYDYGSSYRKESDGAEQDQISTTVSAHSVSEARYGNAYRIQYQYERYQFGSFSASWQYSSPFFSVPSYDVRTGENLYNVNKAQWIASYSRVFNRRWLIGLSRRGTESRLESHSRLSSDLNITTRLFKYLNINLRISEQARGALEKEYEGILTFSWQTYSSPATYDYRYESQSKTSTANYNNMGDFGSHHFKSLLSYGQNNEIGADRSSVTVQYDQPRMTGSIAMEQYGVSDNSQQVGRFDLGSSVVMVNNVWGMSRPVANGFVIVDTDVSLDSSEVVGINPVRGGGFESTISRRLPAVVTGVSPYYVNRIYMDATGTPLEYQAGLDQLNVVTQYKTGQLRTLHGDSKVNIKGRLLSSSSSLIALQVGDWVNMKTGDRVMFFTNEHGEFSLQNLPYGEYRLQLYQHKTAEVIISINDSIRKMHDIGDILVSIQN